MTVSTLTPQRPAPRLRCTWVRVTDADGRSRMEMRWADSAKKPARRAAAA